MKLTLLLWIHLVAQCVGKWRRIFEHKGRDGLTTQMGRPTAGVLSTMAPELQTKLRTLREAHPGWGPQSLLATLRADPAWSTARLPSRSRVAAFLKQEGLTRKYQRHVDLPQPPPQVIQAPHDEWQMDAQGVMKVAGVGKVSVITVIDVASRLKVESCPRAEPSAHRFLSRRLFDRGNKVEEEYAVTFFLSSWKRYLDEHDFVGEVY